MSGLGEPLDKDKHTVDFTQMKILLVVWVSVEAQSSFIHYYKVYNSAKFRVNNGCGMVFSGLCEWQ